MLPVRVHETLPAMGVHVCPASGSLTVRLFLLVLLQAALQPPAEARSLRQRFTFSRKAATAQVGAFSTAPVADEVAGTEVIIVLKPAKGDDTSSEVALDNLKFAVANEGMRPLPLKNFLIKYGMNPKARLPPLKTVTESVGAQEPVKQLPLDIDVEEVAETVALPAKPSADAAVAIPTGFRPTGAPGTEVGASKGDLRLSLTTPIPMEERMMPTVAPVAGTPPPPSTTLMMMMSPDAYYVRSVRPPTQMVRAADGYVMECYKCKCTKQINGGVEELKDPGCD